MLAFGKYHTVAASNISPTSIIKAKTKTKKKRERMKGRGKGRKALEDRSVKV